MSWTTFTPPVVPGSKDNAVRMSVRPAPRGAMRIVTIRIGDAVAKALGVSAGGRLNIDIGEGEQAGKLRLVRTSTGGFVLKAQKGRRREGAPPILFICATGLPGAVDACPVTEVEHVVRGETVILTPPLGECGQIGA